MKTLPISQSRSISSQEKKRMKKTKLWEFAQLERVECVCVSAAQGEHSEQML